MTKTESLWAARVESWRASGQTASAFAAGADFEASTLRCWASRLRRTAGTTGAKPRVRMLRVARTPSAPVTAPIVIAAGGARIEVRAGFDQSLLRDIVAALGEPR